LKKRGKEDNSKLHLCRKETKKVSPGLITGAKSPGWVLLGLRWKEKGGPRLTSWCGVLVLHAKKVSPVPVE